MKFKYLRVQTRGRFADVVAQVDVNHLNKKGTDAEWNRLDSKYNTTDFVSSLTTVERELRLFEDEPNKHIEL